jgi:hypothetical protein
LRKIVMMYADVTSIEDRLFGMCSQISDPKHAGRSVLSRLVPASLSSLPTLEMLMVVGFVLLAIPR